MTYFILKTIHLWLVISWFAGLFYLPRIFVNLAMNDINSKEYEVLLGMARRLLKFMTPIGIGALIFGAILAIHLYWGGTPYWVHAKYSIGIILAVYHYLCYRYYLDFKARKNKKTHKFFRYFNEIPVFLLIIAIFIASSKLF